ncbi:MAG: rhomboid family intramembrane serine protease [Planctomycetes bacterium]|nr:rhomboid family intramembrane serine protease [Planctomycetota bacterium]
MSRSKERKKANEHGLVLQSVGVQTGQMQAEGLWIVLVRLEDLERSRAEIERYERENVGWPPRESYPKPISQGLWAALVYSTLLALLHIWQKNGEFGFEWLAAGRSDAARVSDGEWWRAITALTLHGDVAHLLGNIVFGSVFGVILAQSIGVGLAWNAFLLAGALGNLINAWIQPSEHASIGASTAVFGGLGTQVAYEWMKRRELAYPTLRRWAPVIGGVALLGWLGAGGTFREGATMRENLRVLDDALSKVDVLAHVTGFASGALLGVLLGLRKRRPWMPMHWQIVLTLVPVAVIASAWAIALTR